MFLEKLKNSNILKSSAGLLCITLSVKLLGYIEKLVLANNKKLYSEIVKNTREKVTNKYSIDISTDRLINIFEIKT